MESCLLRSAARRVQCRWRQRHDGRLRPPIHVLRTIGWRVGVSRPRFRFDADVVVAIERKDDDSGTTFVHRPGRRRTDWHFRYIQDFPARNPKELLARHHKARRTSDREWKCAAETPGCFRTAVPKLLPPDSPTRIGDCR